MGGAVVSLPELTAREHEVAAQECDAIADHLEKLAGLTDGPLAPYLSTQHRVDAFAIRARAERHRTAAKIPLERRRLIDTALGSDDPDAVADAMAKLNWQASE